MNTSCLTAEPSASPVPGIAKVIELHPGMTQIPPDPDSLAERCKDAVTEACLAVDEYVRAAFDRCPVVIVRRSRMQRRLLTAFELGRDSGMRRSDC